MVLIWDHDIDDFVEQHFYLDELRSVDTDGGGKLCEEAREGLHGLKRSREEGEWDDGDIEMSDVDEDVVDLKVCDGESLIERS